MISQSDAQQSGINLSWTSLTITSSDGGTTIIAGETSAHFEATMVWEGGDPPAGYVDNWRGRGSVIYPDDITAKDKWGQSVAGTVKNSNGFSGINISSGSVTLIWDAPLRDCPMENVYSEPSCPAGQYTVTFTTDLHNVFDETDETDNTITGTFTVVSDAPIVNVPDDIVVEKSQMQVMDEMRDIGAGFVGETADIYSTLDEYETSQVTRSAIQPQPPIPQSSGFDPSGLVALVIVAVVMVGIIAVVKRKKKTPIPPIPAGGGRKRGRPRSQPSAPPSGDGPSLIGRKACPNCHWILQLPIDQNRTQTCTHCGWKTGDPIN